MDRKSPSPDRKNPAPILNSDSMTTPGLTPGTGMRRVEPQPDGKSAKGPRRIGYGLPCAHCGTYYAADVNACPVCGSAERVSANAVQPVATVDVPSTASMSQSVAAEVEAVPDQEQVLAERDKFLRDYKAKLFATHKLNAAVTFRCTLDENHSQEYEPASVCKSCYDEMEQRADRLDAALRIDLKEAAQIIYDAVWSDPTPGDPGRTYRNAAEALLLEVRRRAGVDMVLASVKPYTH